MVRKAARARCMAEDLQGSTVTTKGSACCGIAGLLHDGADVDFFFGEGAGNFGDDAGAIDDGETDVVRNLELCAEARGDGGNFDAA